MWSRFSYELKLKIKDLKKIFSDFDGTLTDNGYLGRNFIDILNWSQTRELPFTIVTGRSLSWGHFLLTHFNHVRAVISEGGGVLAWKDENGRILERVLVREEDLLELEEASKKLVKTFSLSLSIDSFGRKTDRAIELYELQNLDLKRQVEEFLTEKELNFSCSNVHLNFWKGQISKMKGISYFMENFYSGLSLENCLYFGDAPNDQDVFKELPNCVGVSNINPFLSEINYRPRFVLEGKENEGGSGVLNYLRQLSK